MHATHTLHVLPDLRNAAGRFAGRCVSHLLSAGVKDSDAKARSSSIQLRGTSGRKFGPLTPASGQQSSLDFGHHSQHDSVWPAFQA